MAVSKNGLDVTGSGSKGAGARAIYTTSTDNKAAVKADGYFDSLADEMASVKTVLIVASDATFEAKVAVSGTDVTLSALDAFA